MWHYADVIPALGRGRQEDQKFKVILSYIGSLRLTWERDSVFKKKITMETRRWNVPIYEYAFENLREEGRSGLNVGGTIVGPQTK